MLTLSDAALFSTTNENGSTPPVPVGWNDAISTDCDGHNPLWLPFQYFYDYYLSFQCATLFVCIFVFSFLSIICVLYLFKFFYFFFRKLPTSLVGTACPESRDSALFCPPIKWAKTPKSSGVQSARELRPSTTPSSHVRLPILFLFQRLAQLPEIVSSLYENKKDKEKKKKWLV